MTDFVSEVRDGMRIDWDVPIKVDDGLVLRADVFRPLATGEQPVILTYGPYGKWLHFEDLYTDQWRRMVDQHPDVPAGSTNKYQNWEVVDPEKWVPDGYACVRVDSRGAGRSPGHLDIWSAREAQDLYHCIEWAAAQPWSNGKVGLNGISYYAMNQWQVAALQPPHLSAICIWEGAADYYRDLSHHGGILCRFVRSASKQKWLEVHGIEHWTHFYTDYGVALQKKFLGHFLKGEETGWKTQPKVVLQVRHPGERFVERREKEWPLARTRWTKLYLSPTDQSLSRTPVARRGSVSYGGLGEGVTFLTPPLPKETEITGPIAAKLYVSSQTADADLFLIVRVLTANMKEVVFQGALDPHTPIAQGWLRASHRKLDPKLTLPYRPY